MSPGHVHDDDGVHCSQLPHSGPGVCVQRRSKKPERFDNVDGGENDFLAEEPTHLDLLHDIVSGDVELIRLYLQ